MATVEVAKPHYTWLTSSDQSRNNRKAFGTCHFARTQAAATSFVRGLSRPRAGVRAKITIILEKNFHSSPVSPLITKYRSLFPPPPTRGSRSREETIASRKKSNHAHRIERDPSLCRAIFRRDSPLRQMKKTRSKYLSLSHARFDDQRGVMSRIDDTASVTGFSTTSS